MLFNKDANGTVELQQLTGSYYTSNDWNRTEIFVDLAEQEMIDLLGEQLYQRVDSIYNPQLGSGSAGGGLDPDPAVVKVNTELLKLYRIPIALKAAYQLYQSNLVSHEDQGRKVKIDSDNEKMAWEWMLDRDDEAQRQLIGQTTDRLIKFLEKNEIAEWVGSDKRKLQRELFVNSVEIFQNTYPIDGSYTFFVSVLPWIREVQNKQIKSMLGDMYAPLLAAWKTHNQHITEADASGSGSAQGGLPSAYNQELIDLIQVAIPLQVMLLTVKRRSLQALPNGVVQQFKSLIQTSNAGQVPLDTIIHSWIADVSKDANEAMGKLKDAVISINSTPVTRVLIPEAKQENKYLNL